MNNFLKSKEIARKARKTLLELSNICKGTMHWGGSLSSIEIFTYLYCQLLVDGDKFILSKGHAAPGLYAVLYNLNLLSEEYLKTYQADGTFLSELIEYNENLNFTSSGGSLGINLSYAAGIALLYKKQQKNSNVYILLGDGELNEGAVWEAFMFISKYNLDNLFIIIDNNGYQSDGKTCDILPINNFTDHMKCFNFDVYSINGNNLSEIEKVFSDCQKNNKTKIIIANTIKGKGFSFMENNNLWHDKKITTQEYALAIEEIERYEYN